MVNETKSRSGAGLALGRDRVGAFTGLTHAPGLAGVCAWRQAFAQQRVVEGTPLFDSVATTPAEPYCVAAVTVDVADGNVTLEAGQTDQYTMPNWMSIVPVD